MPVAPDVDVVVIGAGISGIDMAYRLQTMCPDLTYAVLEARSAIGGTWDLFRYPGIRSDSDMFTLGFPFEPWVQGPAIADGELIRAYVVETARKYGIDRRIRFQHKVIRASWDSDARRWTLTATSPDGELTITCRWIHGASGYYDYDGGYTPDFPGQESYAGAFVHPQRWPADLDVAGREVAVIGSGATAVTLVPALAQRGAQVTMIQRTPSYIMARPSVDGLGERLRRRLPARTAYGLIRGKNVVGTIGLYALSRRAPKLIGRAVTRAAMTASTGSGATATDFTPPYDPWDQRLCFAADGDFFEALRSGGAQIVTGDIETFTPDGVRLAGGREVRAEIVVSATGLRLLPYGGIAFVVDGDPLDLPTRHIYRGLMIERVPNFTFSAGYTNASWTLRADLAAQYACRLLGYLGEKGLDTAYPQPVRPLRDTPAVDLSSGYVERGKHLLPHQGDRDPWLVRANYLRDRRDLRRADLTAEMVLTGRAD